MERKKHSRPGFVQSSGAKNLLLLALLLSVLLLAGCQKREKPLEDGESEYQIYYMNQAVTRLSRSPTAQRQRIPDALIGELMENLLHVPADLEAQVVLSDKVVISGLQEG